jgi:catechol 2,3-dioxygenase-like lactoylglutathione lyase family enzyme
VEKVITGIDHVQLAMPEGREADARAFYGGVLGMTEIPKPVSLASRGGCWFTSGAAVVHLGVEQPFAPARKAHPAFVVDDLKTAHARLTGAGYECISANADIPGVARFHSSDPFGNRLEFQRRDPA